MKIKVAIIGLGIMGRRMLEHMGRHESFVPASIWDPDPEACQLAQSICPSAEIAANAAAAMAESDIVYLACPPVPRHQLALAAAAAGKAVFLESHSVLIWPPAQILLSPCRMPACLLP